ncbi:MAG: hypothetical protein OXC65_02050, partial [Thiotrichales bacterium]|nr:hypothetical protein [Thiotrichales bacterium]
MLRRLLNRIERLLSRAAAVGAFSGLLASPARCPRIHGARVSVMPRRLLNSIVGLPVRATSARGFGAQLAALCLLLPFAETYAQMPEKPGGYVSLLPAADQGSYTEGDTINVKIRTFGNSAPIQTYAVRYEVIDDPDLDLLDRSQEGGKQILRISNADHTLPPIRTQTSAKCEKNGTITVKLRNSTAFPPYTIIGAREVKIPVNDNPALCPHVEIEPTAAAALERDGIVEGANLNVPLRRTNAFGGPVTFRAKVRETDSNNQGAFNFIPSGQQDDREFAQGAVEPTNSRYDFPVSIARTNIVDDNRSGQVAVTLLPNDYYKRKSSGKHQIIVPIKNDGDLPDRVLSIQDMRVGEGNVEVRGGASHVGFRLPLRLEGKIGTSGGNPSVRASFVNGGGCQATATARDLAAGSGSANKTPRTNFPSQVIEWDKSSPNSREQSFWTYLVDDAYHEGDETLCVRFDQPRGLTLPGGASQYFATVTITDNDPAPTLSIDAPTVDEGGGFLYFKVTLTNPPGGKAVTVGYTDTKNGTAVSGTDYTALDNGTITFPKDAGDAPQEQTLAVQITDDTVIEEDETVAVRFRQARNADFKDGARGVTARGTITDNDSYEPEVRLREAAPGAGPVVVQEGETAVFHADLWVHEDGEWKIGTLDQHIVVSWRVASDPDATATATGSDFPLGYAHPDSKDADIPPGESGVKLRAPTLLDSTEEPTETFRARLLSARVSADGFFGAPLKITQGFAKGAIYDGPTLRIAAPKGPATEGNRLTFPVTLGMPAATDISVAWTTESLASHTAEAGKDYTAASGTLVFKAGETDKLIVVETLEDSIDEPAEDFSVVLTDPNVTGLDLGPLRATGIIRDNDKRPKITIGDASATEGDKLTLPITLSPAPAVPVKLEWYVRPFGTYPATPGADFTGAESGLITIAAGTASASLEFPTVDDETDEAPETFEVALLIAREADTAASEETDILAPLTATATIEDNDTPSLTINDLEVTEGESAVFTVRLSSPRTYPVEVEFKTKDGGGPRIPSPVSQSGFLSNDARGEGPARDYDGVTTPTAVRFEPGETSKRLDPIQVVDDRPENEYSEYFQGIISLKLGADITKAMIAKGIGLAKIVDNANTRYWIANQNTKVREGRSIRIRVKRDRTEFEARTIFGCIEPTGPHNAPIQGGLGNAGMRATGNDAGAGGQDVYITTPDNPATVCNDTAASNERARPAWFQFKEGEDEASFWVNTVDDSRAEPDETFYVNINGTYDGGNEDFPNGAKIQNVGETRTVFTILDDDDIHRFRVVSANSPWEGEPAHFDIYVESDAGLAALKASNNLFILLKPGADTDTAEEGTHYQIIPHRQRPFDLSSVTSKTQPVGRIVVPTIGDDTLDGDKTLTISFAEIFAGVSTTLPFRPAPGGGTATATIRDDEAYHLSVIDTAADEGDDAIIPVRLSKAADRDIAVRFRTRAGTAKAPRDFTACTASDAGCRVTIPAGETEAQLRIPTTEDSTPEETEQFRVTIQRVDFADMIIDKRAAVVKIRDDDARSVAIAGLADASVAENEAWTSATPSTSGVPDGGLAWTLEGDDAAQFTIDPDTGVVTLPAQNFEDAKDTDTDNVYEITVRVTDEDGNTGTVELSVTVTDVIYGQVNTNTGVDWTKRAIVGEGAPALVSFAYQPYGTQGDLAGRPASVQLTWSLGGLGGSGKASAADLTLSGAGGPVSLQYKASAASLIELARTVADAIDEPGTETFHVTVETDNDDVLIHDAVGKAFTSNANSWPLNFGIRDGFAPSLEIKPTTLRLEESDIASTTTVKENEKTYQVRLNFAPLANTRVAMSLSPSTTRLTLDKSTLTFTHANWNDWQTVKVSAVDDNVANDPLVQEVVISHAVTGAAGVSVAADSVTATVTDDDAVNVISIDSPSVTEGDSGETDLTWTITLLRPAREEIGLIALLNNADRGTAQWLAFNGKLDHEFGVLPRYVDFDVGDSRKTLSVPVLGDVMDEDDETVKLEISAPLVGGQSPFPSGIRHPSPAGNTTNRGYALVTGTILDDDDAPDGIAFTLTPEETTANLGDTASSTREDRGTRSFTAQATVQGDTTYSEDRIVTVTVGAEGDGATSGTDYTAIDPIKLTIKEGGTSASAEVDLEITDDTLNEGDEDITFSPKADDASIDIDEATHTITDDDDAPTVSVADATAVDEGDTGDTTDMSFTVTLSKASGKIVTVPFTLGGTATDGEDYTEPDPLSIEIAAGATTVAITIAVTGDAFDEVDETVIVTLGTPTNATVSTADGAGTAEGVITDDDVAALSIADASAAEGGTATFAVTLNTPSLTDVTVTATTADGSAEAPGDYTHKSETLTIDAGDTSAEFEVAIASDSEIEIDETFSVTLSAAGGATIATATATGTITGAETILSISDASAKEGQNLTFTITRAGDASAAASVKWTTGDDATDGASKATAGEDYTGVTTAQTVSFAASETSKTITVASLTDNIVEAKGGETFAATLASPVGAVLADATGIGTITERNIGFSIRDARRMEGGSIVFGVIRSGDTSGWDRSQLLGWRATDDPTEGASKATRDVDYTIVMPETQRLRFSATDNYEEIFLRVEQDTLDEDDETFQVVLVKPEHPAAVLVDGTAIGTIIDDDDPPEVSVGDAAAVAEGDDTAATTDMTFTVTLSTASGRNVVVPYTLTGTASAGADYTTPDPLSVTIAPGDTEATITVPVKGDLLDESDETIVVTLQDSEYAKVASQAGAGVGTGRITDDDARGVTVSKTKLTLAEADDATTISTREHIGTYTVVLDSKPAAGTVTIAVASGDKGTATVSPASLSFTATNWNTAQTVTVTAIADTVDNTGDKRDVSITHALTAEGDGNDYGGVKVKGVEVTVTDDDEATLSIADASAAEGGTATFTVTLSAPSAGAVTVTATTSEGSATDPEDYTHKTQALTFAAGDTSKDFTVAIASDSVPELDETFTVTLSGATGAAIADGTATGTITGAKSLLSVGDASATEGDAATFTVTRSGDTSAAASVQWRTADDATKDANPATAGADYRAQATAATLSFKAGEASATITVTTTEDAIDEPEETFLVVLSSPSTGVAIVEATGTGTITDDDDAPTVSVSDAAAVAEGNDPAATTDMTFTVTLSAASGRSVVVPYTLTGTASAGADYTAPNPLSVTIAPGDTEGVITVPIKGDKIDESDETVIVTLTTPENADIDSKAGAGVGTGRITDDDEATLSIAGGSAIEGLPVTFTVTLSTPSAEAVTVTATTTDGTATAPGDYTAKTETLTIAAGDTKASFAVTTLADQVIEIDETFTVTLSKASGASIADATATGTIIGVKAQFSVSDASAREGQDASFTITRSGDTTGPAFVLWTTGDDPTEGASKASPGDDYTRVRSPRRVSFAPGDATKTITVSTRADNLLDGDETFAVTLGAHGGAALDDTLGIGTITEGTTAYSVDDASVAEGEDATVTISRLGYTAGASSVRWRTANDNTADAIRATADDDYTRQRGPLKVDFAADATSVDITVETVEDTLDEPDETFRVLLSKHNNTGVLSDDTAIVTITDDDGTPTVSVDDAKAVDEGDAGDTASLTFTVKLSAASGRAVTVPYTLGGSAKRGVDYEVPKALSVSVAPGDDSTDIAITVTGDAVDEANETVTVTLGDPTNATVSTVEGAGDASGTITDDDARGVTVSKTELTLDEADDAATEGTTEHIGTYTVVLDSKPAAGTVTIAVASGDVKTATVSPPSLTFNTGNWSTAQTVTVTAVADAVDNTGDERTATITHSLTATGEGSDYGGVKVADVEVTVTDDDTATLSILDATAAEGGTATFKVTLSAPSAGAVTVTATTAEGSATDPEDYAHKTQALTFAAGDTSKDFTVAIASDSVPELDETFTVTLSGATGAAIADGTATGTITGAKSLLSIGNASAAEGGTLTFTVTRTGETSAAASVQWTTGDDPATDAKPAAAGDDYTAQATAGTLSFKAGEASATVTVATIEDAIDEPDETFVVALSSPSTGVAIAGATGTGTITDDDDAPDGIELSVAPTSVAENAAAAATVTVTATVTGGTTYGAETTVAVTVGEADDSATSGEDYAAVQSFDIDIPAGATSATGSFSLDPTDDAVAEGAEKLTVSGESGDIDVEGAEVTITDDEGTPTATLVLSPAVIDESGASNSSTVTATLSPASSKDLTLTVSAGTGVTLSDNAVLTIDAGETESEGTVTLTAEDNDVDGADLEVAVSATASGGNGVANPANQTLTVRDDDARGVTVAPKTLTVRETDDSTTNGDNESEETYTVVLDSEPAAGTVTVAVTSGDTTAATVSPPSLTFNTTNWNAAQTVTVTGVDDDTDNTDDKRTASVTHAVSTTGDGNDYAALASADPVTVTVTDDDAAPGGIALSVDTPSLGEGADATEVTVTATVTGATRFAEAQTVAVSVGGGTATSGGDYEAVAAFNLTIPAMAASGSATFTLTPTDDDVDEDGETIDVTG